MDQKCECRKKTSAGSSDGRSQPSCEAGSDLSYGSSLFSTATMKPEGGS